MSTQSAPAAVEQECAPLSASSPEHKRAETEAPSPSSSNLDLEEDDDDEAPLLPHERIDLPAPSPSPSPSPSPESPGSPDTMRRSNSAPASSSSSSSGLAALTRATARRLQRRSSTKAKTGGGEAGQAGPPAANREDLIREAQAALDLGPRDPTLSTIVSAMLSAPQRATTTTAAAAGTSTRDFAPVQQLSSLRVASDEADDEAGAQQSALKADMASYINAPSPQPAQPTAQQWVAPNDDDVVHHPRHVVYMRPVKTIGPFGMWLEEFKRWQCCHCGCKTHYENHVCSNLSCMHRRCYENCCTCLPANG